jgi:hypothetical protein
MKTSVQSIAKSAYLTVQDFFLILSKCWLSIIMLLAGIFAFLLNGQGQDIVTAFNENMHWGMSVATACCMLFWGVESWFGARLSLDLSDITSLHQAHENKVAIWLPRILGFLSMTVFYISYLCFKETYWVGDLTILLLPFVIYWFLIVRRRKLIHQWNNSNLSGKYNCQIETNKIKNEAIRYAEVTKAGKRLFLLPLVLFLLLVLAISIFPVTFPSGCTPTIIILLGIAVWTGIATAFGAFEKIQKTPLILITAIVIFLFSYLNNNHTVRTINPVKAPVSIASSLQKWVAQLPSDSGKVKTLYIACGEGGGIRAAYWTASVLASITDSVPAFPKHLFALSTVSGGSLGASAYNAILRYNKPHESYTHQVRDFMKEDYLSPVAAAFLFSDALQRILPLAVGHFDRARYLEWSWEKGWEKNFATTTNPFANGMQQLWNDSILLPNLFLNCAHTESGRRLVVSNLSFNEDEWQSNNVSKLIDKDMPLSSSTLLSARFPILSPGAKIIDSLHHYWGTIVDGGYFDNYGAVTAADLYNDIRKVYKPSELKIVVLMILNSDSIPENPNPIKCAYELCTVPATFLHAWKVKPEKSLNMLTKILAANKDTAITITLDRNKKENLPLGWCLSAKAMKIMDGQLKSARWYEQKKQIIRLMK